MADTFRASKDNQMMRSCPTCGGNVIPIMSPEMECDDCKIDQQYKDLNIKTNKPNVVDDDYLVNATIAEGNKTKKLRKKQY